MHKHESIVALVPAYDQRLIQSHYNTNYIHNTNTHKVGKKNIS